MNLKKKSKAAVRLGRLSRKKVHAGKTAEEISQFYRDLRQKGLDKKAIPNPNAN